MDTNKSAAWHGFRGFVGFDCDGAGERDGRSRQPYHAAAGAELDDQTAMSHERAPFALKLPGFRARSLTPVNKSV
jgi:hypothetical protein